MTTIETATPELQAKAQELYNGFERATRPDGEDFWRLKNGAPEWMTDVVHTAHGSDFLPDDYRYEWTMDAAGAIHDASEDADLNDVASEFADQVDVYTAGLIKWMGSNLQRPGYCDEAVEEFGTNDADMSRRMMLGQYAERYEVFNLVAEALAELVEDEDEDEA